MLPIISVRARKGNRIGAGGDKKTRPCCADADSRQ
jgi:hypothetical protein